MKAGTNDFTVHLTTSNHCRPMPKQVENWGSRPIVGKDWGDSICCCDGTVDACSRIFAMSWFTSGTRYPNQCPSPSLCAHTYTLLLLLEFHGNEDLSTEYQMDLDEEDESSLYAHYHADAGIHDEDDSDDDTEIASINGDNSEEEEDDEFPTSALTSKRLGLARCDSVGASALDLLHLDDKLKDLGQSLGHDRRRNMKLRKYARMSLCVAAASDFLQPKLKRCYRLSESPTKRRLSLKGTPINSILDSTAFSRVLSYLTESELIHSATLVCTRFADVAAEALGNLMLVSVGCDPSSRSTDSDDSSLEEVDLVETQDNHTAKSSFEKQMERGWPYLMLQFPWAQFISNGAFKRVYKVWNNRCGAYEALSVM